MAVRAFGTAFSRIASCHDRQSTVDPWVRAHACNRISAPVLRGWQVDGGGARSGLRRTEGTGANFEPLSSGFAASPVAPWNSHLLSCRVCIPGQ